MGVKKYFFNENPFYEVHVKVRDSLGRQISRRRRGIASKVKAKRLETELKMELLQIRGEKIMPNWEEWVKECLERMNIEYRMSTVLHYKWNLGKRVTPYLKGMRIDKIKKSDVHSVLFHRLSGVSDETRKCIHKNMRRVFNMALEEGLIQHNPALGIKIKVSEKRKKCLSHLEIKTLLDKAYFHNHPFYNIWSIALMTGMRSGELYALLWSDMDFENGFISVNKSWSLQNGIGPTKSAMTREVPISEELDKFLKRLKLSGKGSHVLPRNKDWNVGKQAMVLRKFCKQIGITEIKFHDLRATFITQLLLRDVPLAKVMRIVGHAQIQTTQRYLRLVAKDVQGVTNALGIKLPDYYYKDSDNQVVPLF